MLIIIKMCNLSAVTAVEAKADGAAAFMVRHNGICRSWANYDDVSRNSPYGS